MRPIERRPRRIFVLGAGLLAAVLALRGSGGVLHSQQPAPSPQPGPSPPASSPAPARFHHLQLNSTNPAAAADYYAVAFPSASRTTFAGFEAVKSGDVYLLFTKVGAPPPAGPQSAIWHFGWNTPDSRKYLEKFHAMNLTVVPMYADPEGKVIEISSDGWPGFLSRSQLADAKAKGTQPTHVGGFQYLKGPDAALIENAGNSPNEFFNHVHMYHEDPKCAVAWYVTHLGATLMPPGGRGAGAGAGRAAGANATPAVPTPAVPTPAGPMPAVPTPDNCKQPYVEPSWPAFDKDGMVREPSGNAYFGPVGLFVRPHHGPFVSPRGQVVDHIGFSVPDLDAAVARLRRESVKVLQRPHKWGNTRAAMIEGPDLVALELVEVR